MRAASLPITYSTADASTQTLAWWTPTFTWERQSISPRILIVTLAYASSPPETVPVLSRDYDIPPDVQIHKHCIYGLTVDAGYTYAATLALREHATHVLSIEDDTYPPLEVLPRLLAHNLPIVGAWYPRREEKRRGTAVFHYGDRIDSFDDPERYGGAVCEVWTIPLGCTLINTDVFRTVPSPWFKTTKYMTQDGFFCRRAASMGYTSWCDTSLYCRHIDRNTGIEYV